MAATVFTPLQQRAIHTFACDQGWSNADLGTYVRDIAIHAGMPRANDATETVLQPITQQPQQEGASRRNRRVSTAGTKETGNTQATTQRAPRGSRRQALLNVIRSGNGLSRGDILEQMGLKGDKSGEMSVSNALTGLTKQNTIYRNAGKYFGRDTVEQQAATGTE